MIADLIEVVGFRGEKIVELCLTNYKSFPAPLFRPGFLGDKWPSIDFYVELRTVRRRTPYFFGQTKATSSRLLRSSPSLRISTKSTDVERLLRIPGPTYIFGVHEPSQRVFIRSVHQGTMQRAITTIPITHELTPENLRALHTEVRRFWEGDSYKPSNSVFA
jgi:Domain of unknown function (DUF4365)